MSRDWDERHRAATLCFVPWVRRHVPLENATVFEWGCGSGAASIAFAQHAARLIGVDIEPDPVAEARDRAAAQRLDNASFSARPPHELRAAAEEHAGEIDVFLFFASLEHMTIDERLEALAVARDITRPDGVIVVCESPNRLLPWDYHTSDLPFFGQLPDELALKLTDRSPRDNFREALTSAQRDADGGREVLARWGRGISHHEFELVFGDLPSRVIASNYETEFLAERHIHPEELALARLMQKIDPTLPASFSRYYIDLILAVTPPDEAPSPMKPWPFHTMDSPGVTYTPWETLRVPASTPVVVGVDAPIRELILGLNIIPGEQTIPDLIVQTGETAARFEYLPVTDGWTHFARVELPTPITRPAIVPSDQCDLTVVAYR